MATVNITVPKGWHELSQRQLGLICRLRAMGYSDDAIRMIAFIEWSGIRVRSPRRKAGIGQRHVVVLPGGLTVEWSGEELAAYSEALRWLDTPPAVPVRLDELRGHGGLDAGFRDVPLEMFIACDNLWQGFVITHRDDLLDRLGAMLYRFRKVRKLSAWERVAVALWWSSLKEYLSRRFSEFFRPAADSSSLSSSPSPEAVADAVDAQIRALTKGDVTKEKEVLAAPTWRALAELNAQAREYRELKKISSKNGK